MRMLIRGRVAQGVETQLRAQLGEKDPTFHEIERLMTQLVDAARLAEQKLMSG